MEGFQVFVTKSGGFRKKSFLEQNPPLLVLFESSTFGGLRTELVGRLREEWKIARELVGSFLEVEVEKVSGVWKFARGLVACSGGIFFES